MNINYYVDIQKYREAIIDAFVEEYGEQYRNIITKRYDEIEVFHFINPGGLEEIYCQELKQYYRLKKKYRNHQDEKIQRKIEDLKQELIKLEYFLDDHDAMKEFVFAKHVNHFIEQNKHYLTLQDQIIWEESHDYRMLKHGEILFHGKKEHCTRLYDYCLFGEELKNSGFLASGLLENFLFGIITEEPDRNNPLYFVYQNQKKYEKLVGKVFAKMNIKNEDLLNIYFSRIDMIDHLIADYTSHFVGYATAMTKYINNRYVFHSPFPLENEYTLAAYYPNVRKSGQKFIYSPYICFSPTTMAYRQNDHTFIHEYTHGINTRVAHLSNHLTVYCGLEKLDYDKKDYTKETSERKYEYLNEFLNDYIASKVTKRLHDKGIYIWQKEKDLNIITNSYQRFYFYIEPFYQKYKDYFLAYFMLGDPQVFTKISPSDFNQMAEIADMIYHEYYDTITEIYEKKAADKIKYRQLNHLNKKIKKIGQDYHKKMGL